ncbi:hypothetical protein MCGE09_00093 [Thaumarchaeota archaeon SCGC AB-539-E09]|nr:hypothetical protein MCGE09_00093 [Thaumarchaeota archaeon SCGC AB-539-E09]
MALARELRQKLKADWNELWKTKHDDIVNAEGISSKVYPELFVDRGEIIHATRDYKPLSFSEIFNKHVGNEKAERIEVNPQEGGWGKFGRINFSAKKIKREQPKFKPDLSQPQRKGGSGWLNQARIRRKQRLNSND